MLVIYNFVGPGIFFLPLSHYYSKSCHSNYSPLKKTQVRRRDSKVQVRKRDSKTQVRKRDSKAQVRKRDSKAQIKKKDSKAMDMTISNRIQSR